MFNSITVARARPLAMALHGVNIILSLSRDLNIESDEIREEFLLFFFHLSREGGLKRSNLFERGGKRKSSFNDLNKQNQRNKLKVVGEFILGHNRSQNKIFFW